MSDYAISTVAFPARQPEALAAIEIVRLYFQAGRLAETFGRSWHTLVAHSEDLESIQLLDPASLANVDVPIPEYLGLGPREHHADPAGVATRIRERMAMQAREGLPMSRLAGAVAEALEMLNGLKRRQAA